jgi:hypothetical protein
MIASFTTIRRPTLAVERALWHSGRMVADPEATPFWSYFRIADNPEVNNQSPVGADYSMGEATVNSGMRTQMS